MYAHSMHQLGIAQKDQPANFSTQRRKSNAHKKGGECRNCYLVSLGDLDRFQSPSTDVDLKWWSEPV